MAESDHPNCDQFKDVQNWTDRKIADELFNLTTVERIIVPIIFAIGLVGNVAFLLLLAKVKMMRTITNFYLANLAAADLITLSLATFTRPWRYLDPKQISTEPFHTSFGCIMYYFSIHVSILSSIFLITFVSFDRYFATCHPLKYRINKTKKKVNYILVLLTWIISAILSLLTSLGFGKLVHECILWPSREEYGYFPTVVRHCKPIHPLFQVEILEHLVHSVPFLAALMTNIIVNIKIVWKLTTQHPGENENQQRQIFKRRITWMLLANSVIFFSCLSPFHVLLIFEKVMNLSPSKQRSYLFITAISIYVNSAVNPILYGVASPSYRRGFLKLFGQSRRQVEPIGLEEQETERRAGNS